jgi:hypothetical protein
VNNQPKSARELQSEPAASGFSPVTNLSFLCERDKRFATEVVRRTGFEYRSWREQGLFREYCRGKNWVFCGDTISMEFL